MIATQQRPPQIWRRQPHLVFSPLAWLKLQLFCHSGETEIGGFGVTSRHDLLHVEDFISVRQQTTAVAVSFADDAVADYTDRCVDAGLAPQNFLRVWCHTHPGSSAEPSSVDEDTFARVFGSCDWAVMFILDRAGHAYARLSFHVGPGGELLLPVSVAWPDWPGVVNDPAFSMPNQFSAWQQELAANVQPVLENLKLFAPAPRGPVVDLGSPWEPFGESWDWTDLELELLEDCERHERDHHNPKRA